MKTTLSIIASSFLLVGAGCSTAQPGSLGGLLQSHQQIVTNEVQTPVVSTQATVSRDAATGVTVTNFVTLTNVIARESFVTNTVWETAPLVQHTVDTISAAAPIIPAPFGTFVSFGTGLATVALGWLVRKKNAQNGSLATQLQAVVQGVEKASAVLPEGNKIKATIASVAQKLDVVSDLHKTVQSLT